MDDLMQKIRELLAKDQSQIKLFKDGKITQFDLLQSSKEITKEFLELINNRFPYKNLVPEDIYKGAITLSLHLDLENLQHIFDSYIKNASSQEIDSNHKAIFIDKIRVLSGKPQLYGTQFKFGKNMEVKLLYTI